MVGAAVPGAGAGAFGMRTAVPRGFGSILGFEGSCICYLFIYELLTPVRHGLTLIFVQRNTGAQRRKVEHAQAAVFDPDGGLRLQRGQRLVDALARLVIEDARSYE